VCLSCVKGVVCVVVWVRGIDRSKDVGRLFVGQKGSVEDVLIGGRGAGMGSEKRTLSDASAGVAAVGASVLLDVERAGACIRSSVSISIPEEIGRT